MQSWWDQGRETNTLHYYDGVPFFFHFKVFYGVKNVKVQNAYIKL